MPIILILTGLNIFAYYSSIVNSLAVECQDYANIKPAYFAMAILSHHKQMLLYC